VFYEKKNDAEFFEKIAHETKQTEAKSAIKNTFLKTTTTHAHALSFFFALLFAFGDCSF
jgi:hypothetical protein